MILRRAPVRTLVPDAKERGSTDDGLVAGSESQAEDAGSDVSEPKRPVRFLACCSAARRTSMTSGCTA
jgi:hypothetical protein